MSEHPKHLTYVWFDEHSSPHRIQHRAGDLAHRDEKVAELFSREKYSWSFRPCREQRHVSSLWEGYEQVTIRVSPPMCPVCETDIEPTERCCWRCAEEA